MHKYVCSVSFPTVHSILFACYVVSHTGFLGLTADPGSHHGNRIEFRGPEALIEIQCSCRVLIELSVILFRRSVRRNT